jgi:hypothetical protein
MKHARLLGALCALALMGFGAAEQSHAQSLEFTVTTTTSDGRSVVPKLTWASTPAAVGCTASGATDWTGTKAASGTATLAAINVTRSYTISCTWAGDLKATVSWVPPSTYTDGSTGLVLGGYRIQYGLNSADLSEGVYLQEPAATSWVSPTLTAGQWFFAVRAFTPQGLESPLSNVASKTLTAGTNQSRTLEVVVKFPARPTEVEAR